MWLDSANKKCIFDTFCSFSTQSTFLANSDLNYILAVFWTTITVHEPSPPALTKPQVDIVIRLSPLVFIIRLLLIELTFVIIATVLSFALDVQILFSFLPFSNSVSANILTTLLFGLIQVAVIGLSFLTWYLESYTLKTKTITHRGGNTIGERELTDYSDIKSVNYTQNRLQTAYNYGTLKLNRSGKLKPVLIKNIPNPSYHARLIRQFVPDAPQTSDIKMLPISKLLKQKEGKSLEFKSSLLWDYQQNEINKELKKAVMKNVAAFLNTRGGILLIGVDDNRKVLGLEKDIQAVPKKNLDSFENILNTAFNQLLGLEFRQYVDIEFQKQHDKDICCLLVYPSPEPVFMAWNGSEEFYIRTGNSSQPLTIKKALQYIKTRFETT